MLSTIGARVVDRELPIGQADEALDADGLPREREVQEQLSAMLDELLDLTRPQELAA